MFDRLKDQMKAESMEGSPKEKLMRLIVIGGVSVLPWLLLFSPPLSL